MTVSRFAPDEDDRIARGTTELPSILTAIVEVGGGYGDWVSFIRECSEQGYLTEPIAMNPVPQPGVCTIANRNNRSSLAANRRSTTDIPFTPEKTEEPNPRSLGTTP